MDDLFSKEEQSAAHKAVEDFVNSRKCNSREDVLHALKVLTTMAVAAINVVQSGYAEIVQ